MVNYNRLQIESYKDIFMPSILVYADGKYSNIDSIISKLLQKLKSKYSSIVVYSNMDIQIEDVIFIKKTLPLRELLTTVCFRENSKFIGFMKTNTFMYSETVAYLKCANISYRIYDVTNNKWISNEGNNVYY